MKACAGLCALLLYPLLALAGPKAGIDQLEKDFNAAYAANDLDKYFSYYAADAVLWFPDGRTDLASYRKMWTAYIDSGAKLQRATLSDYRVKLSPQGDAAVASYLLHVTTLEASKRVTHEDYQETDVWFKAAGAWKIAHVHYSSPAPRPVPAPVTPRKPTPTSPAPVSPALPPGPVPAQK
jgi:ketosteroid isomerase-like protein